MAEVIYDIDLLAKVYNIINSFEECFGKFSQDGVAAMRNCGIMGGNQGMLINRACDTIEEKCKEMNEGIKEMNEDLKVVIGNAQGFDEDDVIKRAEQIASDAQKVDTVGIKKVY